MIVFCTSMKTKDEEDVTLGRSRSRNNDELGIGH